MNKTKIVALGVVITAIILGGLSSFLSPPQSTGSALSAMLLIVVPVIFGVLHLGAVPFFVSGVKNFKPDLRIAYMLICIGITLFSIAQLQFPMLSALDMWKGFWIDSGLLAAPYVLPGIFFFLGARRFTNALKIKTPFSSVWLVAAIAILSVGIAALLPHKDIGLDSEFAFDSTTGIIVWSGVWYAASGFLLASVKKKIGILYAGAMAWLSLAYWILAFASIPIIALQFIGYENLVGDYFILTPYIFSGLAFLRAAYAFEVASKY